jgi:hypothetical protein
MVQVLRSMRIPWLLHNLGTLWLAAMTFSVSAQGQLLSPREQQFEQAAAMFREQGVTVHLVHGGEGSDLYISSSAQAGCGWRLCRVLRRLELLTKKELVIRIADIKGGGGFAYPRMSWANLDISELKLFELLNFRDPLLRHELQHALINQNMANHFLNGEFVFPNGIGGIYRNGFSLQELFTQTDQNARVWTYRSEGYAYSRDEEMIFSIARFLGDWKKNNVTVDVKETDRAGFISEKYTITLENSEGVKFVFFSDLPYHQLTEQVPKQIAAIIEIFRIWVEMLAKVEPPPHDKMARLKELFKSPGNTFRFLCGNVL